MKKFVNILYEGFLLFCGLFTVGTIVNTIGFLYFGIQTNDDVHRHIMTRAVLMLVVTIVVSLLKNIPFKLKRKNSEQSGDPQEESFDKKESGLLSYAVKWVILLLTVTLFVWAFTSGYLFVSKDEFSPHAFWHLFRSTVIPGFAVAIIGFFIKLSKIKKSTGGKAD